MQDGPISSDVARLKELLFEPESQAIVELRQRIDVLSADDRRLHADLIARLDALARAQEERRTELAQRVADMTAEERAQRADIARRLEALLERAGTAERFTQSVAASLDEAMRRAEIDRHTELSAAIAPLVVRTIKTEIRSSHDELADALYPHMGRMVKSYVASAMKDLADQINRRLEQNPLMLRLRSLTTGRSVAELAMAESMRLQVDELYLIRRGTGELVGRWPEAPGGANRDAVLGGTLAAINEFSAEAFAGGGSELRRVDLGTAQIYLRASPLHLLAAKCSGSAPAAVEQVVDEAFLAFIAQHRDTLLAEADGVDTGGTERPLKELAGNVQQQVAERQAEIAVPPLGFAPLKWAAALILLPLVGWTAWSWYLDWRTTTTRQAALAAIAETGELKGYRTHVDVERGGRSLTVVGLAPSDTVKSAALVRVMTRLPGVQVSEELVVLPNSALQAEQEIALIKRSVAGLETSVGAVGGKLAGIERQVESVGGSVREAATATAGVRRDLSTVEAELARAAERRALMRAASRLDQLIPDLRRLEGELTVPADREAARRALTRTGETRTEIRARLAVLESTTTISPEQPTQSMLPWRLSLLTDADNLAALIGQRRMTGTAATEIVAQASAAEQAEDVAAAVERLAAIAAALEQANALRLSLPKPPPPAGAPTPRDRLAAFIRDHAIFFGTNADYRDPAATDEVLARLEALMSETDVLLRVVGYTDERGGQQRNTSLSQARADKVLAALVAQGVPRERLVAVGRLNNTDLSPATGANSPNRRVEFEIGFVGEGGRVERTP
jgi:outer membrane protein OmpA-like peptidoglycan-associated protein